VNVFKGIFDNYLFCGILLTTSVLQVLIVQYGSIAFKVAKGGLDAQYWALSLVLGAASLLVQQFINFIYGLGQRYNVYKNRNRSRKGGHLTTLRTNCAEHAHSHSE
jgi:P-type Ca2+ transporter type 2B